MPRRDSGAGARRRSAKRATQSSLSGTGEFALAAQSRLREIVDGHCAILDEGASSLAVGTAHGVLHFDGFQLNELFGREVHGLAVGIVGTRAAFFGLHCQFDSRLYRS